jgi:hypothetical protein
MDENSCTIDVELMANAKTQLDGLLETSQNVDFKCIAQLVNAYLRKYCNHTIVSDMIDISDTCSKTIYYCEYCGLTFDGLSAPK